MRGDRPCARHRSHPPRGCSRAIGPRSRAPRQGGMTVAVLGNPRTDEAAMSAADVPVAMPSLGGASGEWGVMLASDDVRDGALAISLARRTKNEARTALILALAPGSLLALAVAFGLFASPPTRRSRRCLGAVASALHARATDLTRRPRFRLPRRPTFQGLTSSPTIKYSRAPARGRGRKKSRGTRAAWKRNAKP